VVSVISVRGDGGGVVMWSESERRQMFVRRGGGESGQAVRLRDPYPYQTRPCQVTFDQCQVTSETETSSSSSVMVCCVLTSNHRPVLLRPVYFKSNPDGIPMPKQVPHLALNKLKKSLKSQKVRCVYPYALHVSSPPTMAIAAPKAQPNSVPSICLPISTVRESSNS